MEEQTVTTTTETQEQAPQESQITEEQKAVIIHRHQILQSKGISLVPFEDEDWFVYLLEEADAILTERDFNARMEVILGYYELGKRISMEKENFSKQELYGMGMIKVIAERIGKSAPTIYKAVQFYEKYPTVEAFDKLQEGKNISWYEICKKYLPAPKDDKEAQGATDKQREEEERELTDAEKADKERRTLNAKFEYKAEGWGEDAWGEMQYWRLIIPQEDYMKIDFSKSVKDLKEFLAVLNI